MTTILAALTSCIPLPMSVLRLRFCRMALAGVQVALGDRQSPKDALPIMVSLDTFDAAQSTLLFLKHLQRGDRHKAMEQLVLLGLELSVASEPLPLPGLQVVSQEAVKTSIRELTGLIGKQRDIAAGLAAADPHSVALVTKHDTALLEAMAIALAALCEHRGFLVMQD